MTEERRPPREHTRFHPDTGKASLVNEGVHYPDDAADVDWGRVESLRASTAALPETPPETPPDGASSLAHAHTVGWNEGARAMAEHLSDLRVQVAAMYEAESAREAFAFMNDREAQTHPGVFAKLTVERTAAARHFEHADSVRGGDEWQVAAGAAYGAFDDYAFKHGMLVATEQLNGIAPVVHTGATPENVVGLAAAWGAADTAEQNMVGLFPERRDDVEQHFNGVYDAIAQMYDSDNPASYFSDALESLERRVLAEKWEPVVPFSVAI